MTDLTALAAPFPVNAVNWRVDWSDGTWDKQKRQWTKEPTRARVLCYIDARDVQDRLDDVVGIGNWQSELERVGNDGWICRLKIKINDEWVTKTDVGTDSQFEGFKGGASDALKRAAVQFGVGRYLYRVPSSYVTCKGDKYGNHDFTPPTHLLNGSKPEPPKAIAVDSESHEKMLLIDEIMLMSKAAFKTLDERDAKFDELKANHEVERLSDLSMPVLERLKARLVDLRIELESETEPDEPATPPLSLDRVKRIKDELAKAYGVDKVQRHIKLIYQTYGVKTLQQLTVEQYKEITFNAQQSRVRKDGNGRKPQDEPLIYVSTGGKLYRKFHATGNSTYGQDGWKTRRPQIVAEITGGRTESSKEMTEQEIAKAIEYMTLEYADGLDIAQGI